MNIKQSHQACRNHPNWEKEVAGNSILQLQHLVAAVSIQHNIKSRPVLANTAAVINLPAPFYMNFLLTLYQMELVFLTLQMATAR